MIYRLVFWWCPRELAWSVHIFLVFFLLSFSDLSNSSAGSLTLDTLFSTCSILLPRLSTEVLIWVVELFIYRIFIWFFGISVSFFNPSSYPELSPYSIQLFILILSEFIQLLICILFDFIWCLYMSSLISLIILIIVLLGSLSEILFTSLLQVLYCETVDSWWTID
jgi:hypothetical protein